ncbi:hypothetical protein BFW38_06040 [Terasakiispira papahanaumokuakeensis]|uniref:Biotin carboxylase n=1 Tax=Terasakiispira papahanaumokuakeensis TaxID=197479 RepID=A0A1E2V866_9GAMM|nr:acetyl/propionyl/methylcrotonyl-CoA carboxylase subunit alpha [Terasakiispira papahanaumokuakeensis]ODC03171.1 hypothetical protein BFW38_06040 [Terasakiispira papahanaumokuakeensis]
MFQRLLIANRGEIACRIMRTAQRLGIHCIAVYSEADRHSAHVEQADEAILIGPAPAQDSYLNIERIMEAAHQTQAQAIHPGYGFLSENADFVRACKQAGLVFIGPPAEAIEAMGTKAAAKALMKQAQVPVIAGYHGEDQSDARLAQEAAEIGYPVMIKASAGGGGKGMRVVEQAEAFNAALESCRRESLKAFGDDKMLIEKLITRPRHVEVQVFCDQHGQGVYLFERDCSLQRRHQKVIEEAPAPGLSESLRQSMGEAAVRAAQAIDYVGAGTVEFLLDDQGHFSFMEMNTRLQVEHPVTEMITGEDLVDWQLRIAAGQPLPRAQTALLVTGHAFEARIYAEDPQHDFLPATGTLHHLVTPPESPQLRIETGVRQGDEISIYYDPMIAKLVVWGEDRASALKALSHALSQYQIAGVSTNISFLKRLADHPEFKQQVQDTGFIQRHLETLTLPPSPNEAEALTVMGCYLLHQRLNQHRLQPHEPHQHLNSGSPRQTSTVAEDTPWDQLHGWRLNAPARHCFELKPEHARSASRLEFIEIDSGWQVCLADHPDDHDTVQFEWTTKGLCITLNGHRRHWSVSQSGTRLTLFTSEGPWVAQWVSLDHLSFVSEDIQAQLKAPMNGAIVSLQAALGEPVKAGDPLIIMEAMKMEHTLYAPAEGVVSAFHYAPGDLVNQGDELLHFEASTEASSAPDAIEEAS